MTDNEFDDLNEEAMEAPKAEVKKKVTKKKAVKKVVAKTVETVEVVKEDKVFDIQFANAVKVGIHQKNYYSNDDFDITIRGNIIEVRLKIWPADKSSVFTTLYNVIHWRMK
jgi:hypothetical protein